MGKYLGIKYSTRDFLLWFHNNLKRELLFFNELLLINFDKSFEDLANSVTHEYGKEYSSQVLSELELLQKHGLIKNEHLAIEPSSIVTNNDYEILQRFTKMLLKKKEVILERRNHFRRLSNRRGELECNNEIENLDHAITDYITRSRSIVYNSFNFVDNAIPILYKTENTLPFQHNHINVKRVELVKLILDKIPVPTSQTPIHLIIDYRLKSESQFTLSGLKVWINIQLSTNKALFEINDELDFELEKYKQELELFRINTIKSRVETIVLASAQMMDSLVRLKFGDAINKLLTASKHELFLLESEKKFRINHPHVAYIYDITQKKFT